LFLFCRLVLLAVAWIVGISTDLDSLGVLQS